MWIFLDLFNDHPITKQPKFCNNKNCYDRPDGGTYTSLFVIVIASQFVDNFLPGNNLVQDNKFICRIINVAFDPFFAETFNFFLIISDPPLPQCFYAAIRGYQIAYKIKMYLSRTF